MSQANYIIICNGRTQALGKMRDGVPSALRTLLAASQCAADVVANLSEYVTTEDVQPISTLLHSVMASLAPRNEARAAEFFAAGETIPPLPELTDHQMWVKTCELFRLCDSLSEKYEEQEVT